MALRTLVHRGTEWTVWDVVPTDGNTLERSGSDQNMTGGWLAFRSGNEKRRVVPSPAGWEKWPDSELAACLDRAEPITRESSFNIRRVRGIDDL